MSTRPLVDLRVAEYYCGPESSLLTHTSKISDLLGPVATPCDILSSRSNFLLLPLGRVTAHWRGRRRPRRPLGRVPSRPSVAGPGRGSGTDQSVTSPDLGSTLGSIPAQTLSPPRTGRIKAGRGPSKGQTPNKKTG